MRGTVHVWYHAPGEGTRKWAIALDGDRKERHVVDSVIFRGVMARTMMLPTGKGVVEVPGAKVEIMLIAGDRSIGYVLPDDGIEVASAQGN